MQMGMRTRQAAFALFALSACATGVGAGAGPRTTTGRADEPPTATKKSGQSFAFGGIHLETWRPFSLDSPWNTPIGPDPALAPDNAALVADWASSSPYGPHLDVNIAGYSIPLYEADALTPTYNVRADIGGSGWIGRDGHDTVGVMPIPDGALPDPNDDHHLLVVDRHRMIEWGCWAMQRERRFWHAGLCATADLNGTGVRPIVNGNPTWYTSHGARACGFPLVAGLIRVDEIKVGRINHALVVAYPHIRAGWYTPPASTAQAGSGDGDGARPDRGIPCGGRIQFDPSIDLDALNLTRSGRVIMRALQEYGAYVGDYSGALSLYAEGSPEAQAYWKDGVLDNYELKDRIDLSSFRVLELGQLYDNGNGNG
jgi:hypothetical protein